MCGETLFCTAYELVSRRAKSYVVDTYTYRSGSGQENKQKRENQQIAYLSVCVRPDAITLIRQLHALF
jgi:hypothetical protein